MPTRKQFKETFPKTLLADVDRIYRAKLVNKVTEKSSIPAKDGCWLWNGGYGDSPNDYGYLYVHGRFTGAHRLVYALYIEDFPINLQVLHRCDTPRCVRPDHLFLGTNLDNMKDKVAKLRAGKLSKEDVTEIHRLNREGVQQYVIAERFDMSQGSVGEILRGETYEALSEGYQKNNVRGSKNLQAKLTEQEVSFIKKLLDCGRSVKAIAESFGVWTTTIYSIRDGKTWEHVK